MDRRLRHSRAEAVLGDSSRGPDAVEKRIRLTVRIHSEARESSRDLTSERTPH
jgi:hypothetical protein